MTESHQNLVLSSAIKADRSEAMRAVVGEKAFGLARLPDPWIPPFIAITTSACDALAQGDASLVQGAAEELLALFRCAASETLIVRSSAQAEGLTCRGRLMSKTCGADVTSIVAAATEVLKDFDQERKDGESCALLVHVYRNANYFGHLSNEQRVGKAQRDFLAEITNGDVKVVSLQAKKQVAAADPNANIESNHDIEGALRGLARWLHLELGRVHVEWISSNGRLLVVQCDSEDDAPLREPMASWAHLSRPEIEGLKAFRRVGETNTDDLRKTRSLAVFQRAGLSTTPVYILRGAEYLRGFDGDRAPHLDVLEDLAVLVKMALVIRIDILANGYEHWQNLPAKVPVCTVEDAVGFLRRALQEQKGVARADMAIVVHHFIPARAAAWSECNIGTMRVRVDAAWGHPDGLQSFPCDTVYVDLRGDQVTAYIRYKDEFLDIGADTKAFRHRASPSLALQPVMSSDDALQIARQTQRVAEVTGKSTRVMWFLETGENANVAPIFPWIIDDCEVSTDAYLNGETDIPRAVIPGSGDHARRLIVGGIRRIESPTDLVAFSKNSSAFDLGGKRVVFRPTDSKNIRSKDFVRDVGQVALSLGWKIVLEGSVLTHNYYLLRTQGVDVESAAEYLAEPRRRRIFGKLVRDKVPELIRARGEQLNSQALMGGDLKYELLRKLVEESFEAATASTDTNLKEELADLYEVIQALLPIIGVDASVLVACADQKRAKRGGFSKGEFLVSTGGEGVVGSSTRRAKYMSVEHAEGEIRLRVPLVPPDAERLEESDTAPLGDSRVQISAVYEGDQVIITVRRVAIAEQLNLFRYLDVPALPVPRKARPT